MAYINTDKAEYELSQSIRKATSSDETAPKQKHVRNCIVYTWDHRTSALIWQILKVQPIQASEIQTFKALILVHKLLKDGHPSVLRDALQETDWLEACGRNVTSDGIRGYGTLIKNYVQLLLHKIRFHRNHPAFNGTFDYEEYVSLKNVDDPNEGFETISDLMDLQDHIDQFGKLVFNSLLPTSHNECRIAALVPLVEESYGIYKFVTSMLRAMHSALNADDALAPLRQRYNAQHYQLLNFYNECACLKYLTSLITVPRLSADPPPLMDARTPPLPHRPAASKSAVDPTIDLLEQQQAEEQKLYEQEQQRLAKQREEAEEYARQAQWQQQKEFERQQRLLAEQQQQGLSQSAGNVNALEMQLLQANNEIEQSRLLLQQYDHKVNELKQELALAVGNAQHRDSSKDDMIRSLQADLQLWQDKYDALAKLYAQLRKEHIELVNKHKALQARALSVDHAKDEIIRMKADVQAKNIELADLIRERDRARNALERIQTDQKHETERLKAELKDARDQAESMGKSKGTEVSALLTKFNKEKTSLESVLSEKQALIDEFLEQIEEQQADADRTCKAKDEEIAVLQAGMDECLQQLQNVQSNTQAEQHEKRSDLDGKQTSVLDQILDKVLTMCIQKINDGIYDLETPGQPGNDSATPELALSVMEKTSILSTEFMSAVSKFFDGSESGDHVLAVSRTLELADAMIDVLLHAKGMTHLMLKEDDVDNLITLGKQAAESCITFYSQLISHHLQTLSPTQRSNVVIQGNDHVQEAMTKLAQKTEELISTNTGKHTADEMSHIVDTEMSHAAQAIEAATARIQELMRGPTNPKHSATDLQVHQLILQSVSALTNTIGRLIQCATASQKEIVAQSGTQSKAAFYKKHNRWTEGLVSAAKAVAAATSMLVEAADGVISKTHSFEQLIIASNQVSAASAQLVVASRVKSSLISKTQERLELAAKDVKEAAQSLVAQIREIVSQKEPQDTPIDLTDLSSHEFKRKEMEQQVHILKLDAELTRARRALAEMRRSGYHTESE